jgi:hypothetical protein
MPAAKEVEYSSAAMYLYPTATLPRSGWRGLVSKAIQSVYAASATARSRLSAHVN